MLNLFFFTLLAIFAFASADPIRGVNVGNWLILEKWLGGDIWNSIPNASDEWTACEALGENAPAAMQNHWSTWFTQDTVNQLASYGINTLRIPIGYWAIQPNASDPYVTGAQDYLDQAIGWARSAGLKVWVDLHGAPGSQNGYDNSGHSGTASWQTDSSNIPTTISIIEQLAAKYSGSGFSDVVTGLELLNEPISWDPQDVAITRQYYSDAYAAAQAALTDNKDLTIIIHDSFVDLSDWADFPAQVGASYNQLSLDTHIYQVFSDADNELNGSGHIVKACNFQNTVGPSNEVLPTIAGEWTAAENVCINADGSTINGTSCSSEGCQCTTDDPANWSSDLVNLVRGYVEAQMDVFEGNGTGYFFWAHTGPGSWNFMSGVQQGWIPQPLTARAFPGQCGFTLPDITAIDASKRKHKHRRVKRGLLGMF
ncbi:glycoside hydrolase superfamily [Lipomyces arxii]|uniref:glycoside hydrolase superfamily n=1 Tax=Lipomyces arxii TaxID=56418 RepID=UPI0034CE4C5B